MRKRLVRQTRRQLRRAKTVVSDPIAAILDVVLGPEDDLEGYVSTTAPTTPPPPPKEEPHETASPRRSDG